MKVYLCGGINGLPDSQAKDWREEAKRLLGNVETLDPMRRDYRGREDECVNEIVYGDLDDIAECDVILAMCTRPSWGTAMEIFHAYRTDKIVYVVVGDGPVSPWLRFHSHAVCRSLVEAVEKIRELA